MRVPLPRLTSTPRQESHRSLWLDEVAGDSPAQPPLEGDASADVAIIGGGYVGLWTAIRIKERDPACDVAILERDVCGSGASGRNGGMALSWWPKLASLVRICGNDEALRLAGASESAVDEIEGFCAAHGIDAHFRRGGLLWTATAPAQVGAWDPVLRLCERLGVEPFRRLSASEVAERTGSDAHLAGVFDPKAATVQPAALARGLRRVALDMGVRIHERSPMRSFTRDRPLAISTDHGLLRAETLVIAMNAWSGELPELRRSIVVVSSDIVVTPPAPDRLTEVGWTGGEGITDSQTMVDYYRTTRDGRIAFGKGTAGVGFGGRIDERFDRDTRRARLAAADFRRYYPALADLPLVRDWAGPIDRTPTSVPILGHLGGREHIIYGVGWSGNGVGPSVIGGRILSSLALAVSDEWSTTPLVDRQHDRFPPEPVRFLGAKVVRRAVMAKERTEANRAAPSALAERLARLAPAGLEDKE